MELRQRKIIGKLNKIGTMLDVNNCLRRKGKRENKALQCLECREAEISNNVAKERLVEETFMSKSNVWQESISGRRNSKEASVAKFE